MVWFAEPEEFDTEALGALVRDKTGGELHEGVRRAPVWRSRDEQSIANKRLAELKAIYDQRPHDIDDPEWSDIAVLLSTPPEARFGRISYTQVGGHYDVYAARNHWFGLLVHTDDTISYVRTFRREHPSEAIVAALQEWVWKSDEQPIHVTRSALDAADNSLGFREPHPQVKRVQQLMHLPAYLTGEFYAECQHGADSRGRTERPLLLYGMGSEQYDAGCWTLQVMPRGRDTELLFAPSDIDDLARRIEQLRRDLD